MLFTVFNLVEFAYTALVVSSEAALARLPNHEVINCIVMHVIQILWIRLGKPPAMVAGYDTRVKEDRSGLDASFCSAVRILHPDPITVAESKLLEHNRMHFNLRILMESAQTLDLAMLGVEIAPIACTRRENERILFH